MVVGNPLENGRNHHLLRDGGSVTFPLEFMPVGGHESLSLRPTSAPRTIYENCPIVRGVARGGIEARRAGQACNLAPSCNNHKSMG